LDPIVEIRAAGAHEISISVRYVMPYAGDVPDAADRRPDSLPFPAAS
jgi:hypothetical protein